MFVHVRSVSLFIMALSLLFPSVLFPSVHAQSLTESKKYPQRIISLSPHTTELVFAAGGGDRLIGVSAYSDYPEAAKTLPIVASSQQINVETILALEPDMIIYWQQGNSAADIEQLKKFGIPVYASKTGGLDDIGIQIQRLGRMLGTEKIADPVSDQYRTALATLRTKYKHNPQQDLFYQVWPTPLMTVANDPWLQQQFQLCGFNNVFNDSPVPYPVINVEQVLVKQPAVIIAGSVNDAELAQWQIWKSIPAVKHGNIFRVNPDVSHRFSPRVVQGIETLCEIALQAQKNTDKNN
ncbi:cobalamin-binding protein [Moritella marina ATCC 15381]|uniref:Cobalamin-binding protein n=1 Tax=Moritella marina ATCC 15381 TaxID=1202962 RepID=A0A5J6WHA6_MORMI|nr:cobalamin-binding protein [Moritella marina]QFI36501.1 cobalamin-binding protein [Moritella marina ATCC 15381]